MPGHGRYCVELMVRGQEGDVMAKADISFAEEGAVLSLPEDPHLAIRSAEQLQCDFSM